MEEYLENAQGKERALSWQALLVICEINKKVSDSTMRRMMGDLNFSHCIACKRGWVSEDLRHNRVSFAREMKARFPNKKDWRNVRFSDEVHFGKGAEGRLYIIRKPGERYCSECIIEEAQPEEKDKKRYHAWGCIGYNYKSELILYSINSNTNGKMNQDIYIQMLSRVIIPDQQGNPHLILKEDGDSAHFGKKVTKFKEQYGLRTYRNCRKSLDLAPIENVWQPVKGNYRKEPHWDDETCKQRIYEAWNELSQETINAWIESMPDRLEQVLDREGRMTSY